MFRHTDFSQAHYNMMFYNAHSSYLFVKAFIISMSHVFPLIFLDNGKWTLFRKLHLSFLPNVLILRISKSTVEWKFSILFSCTLILKPCQIKKGRKFVSAAPKMVSFSQLPTVKKFYFLVISEFWSGSSEYSLVLKVNSEITRK